MAGARVRRAKGRRPPQFLDLDADVKFADVAGLGDIRKELEEIVDFFTYGEKYRRRGSKIPGMSCNKDLQGNSKIHYSCHLTQCKYYLRQSPGVV